jgi:hypothetical protein
MNTYKVLLYAAISSAVMSTAPYNAARLVAEYQTDSLVVVGLTTKLGPAFVISFAGRY